MSKRTLYTDYMERTDNSKIDRDSMEAQKTFEGKIILRHCEEGALPDKAISCTIRTEQILCEIASP
jgi:hypothetical protein